MLQPGGLHPMFFHDLFISPSALSESPTLDQGNTCRKDPEVSFLFIQETMKLPRSSESMALWEAPGGIQR